MSLNFLKMNIQYSAFLRIPCHKRTGLTHM
jgi:hypothetical protein